MIRSYKEITHRALIDAAERSAAHSKDEPAGSGKCATSGSPSVRDPLLPGHQLRTNCGLAHTAVKAAGAAVRRSEIIKVIRSRVTVENKSQQNPKS